MEKIIARLKVSKLYLFLRNLVVGIYLRFYKFYSLNIAKYQYNPANYKNSFLSNFPKTNNVILKNADEVIYVFWTGTNELTENRKKGLDSLKEKSGVKVKLVTPANLHEFILKEYPLHEGYQYLSLIQKSDYLRCYFMLHHGGGYADIKVCKRSWKDFFLKVNKCDDKWVIGIREMHSSGVPNIDGSIGIDIKKYHNLLIGNGGYVYKPNSPICKEWMEEVHNRMDYYLRDLKKCSNVIYDEDDYPIPWAFLAAHVMHPLILKYHEKVIRIDDTLYSTENYR